MYNHPFPLRIRSGKAVVIEPIAAPVYEKHRVGPHPVRVRKGWRKPAPRAKRPLTSRELKRSNPEPNQMPAFVAAVMAHHRITGRATPNADRRRAEQAS